MQCSAPNGTSFPNFVNGKTAYFGSKHNARTTTRTFVNPSVDQLAQELRDGEDVEILMNFGDPSFRGHFVTLYDISFETDTGEIKYIDPLDGQPHHSALLGNGAEPGYFVDYFEPNGTEVQKPFARKFGLQVAE
jgi:hypothetical protein